MDVPRDQHQRTFKAFRDEPYRQPPRLQNSVNVRPQIQMPNPQPNFYGKTVQNNNNNNGFTPTSSISAGKRTMRRILNLQTQLWTRIVSKT